MAVPIDGISVVIANAIVEARFPGGLAAYERECPNGTYCSDGQICRVAFMVEADAKAFAERLTSHGFRSPWSSEISEMAIGDMPRNGASITRFGTVVGFGLLLVGTFPLAYGAFVDPIGLRGPVPPDYPNPETTANAIIHIVFYIGTLMGVVTYPIWIILLGRQLLRARGF